MRFAILGGTRPTGQILVDLALEAGHQVTAYARTPSKLPTHERLTVVEGHLDDAAAIARTVRGADAVLSLLGPGTNTADIPPLVTGYRHLVAAMHQEGVKRLVALGTPSMSDPSDRRDLKVGLMVAAIRAFQRVAYDAIVEIGRTVRSSDLDWTIVRVPLLSNGPATTQLNVRTLGTKGGIRLSRTNAARFFLERATETRYIGQAPCISDN